MRALVIYLHGIEGHTSWFTNTAEYLVSCGIGTRAMDRRGSGLSKEPRGDMPSHQRLLHDVEEVIEDTFKNHKNTPIFLMANCWGAKLAAILCKRNSAVAKKITGLVLSSPAVAVKIDLPLRKKLEVLIRYLSGNRAPIDIPLKSEHFTDNPEFLPLIEADALRLRQATARFLIGGVVLTRMSANASKQIDMPMMIVQSGIDDIVDIDGVKKWIEVSPSQDKTLKIFSGAYHSLDFHREPSEYRTVLSEWLLARCKSHKERP